MTDFEHTEFVGAARALLAAGWKRPRKAQWPVRGPQEYALLSPTECVGIAYSTEHPYHVQADALWYGALDEDGTLLYARVDEVWTGVAILAACSFVNGSLSLGQVA